MSTVVTRRRAVAVALLSVALLPPVVRASDDADLNEVIVVGHSDTPITVVPRGLSVSLGQADFDAINAVNVEDLMKYAPNFFVRKRYAGDDNAVVALRGTNTVQSARTLVMVDGFLVSNFLGNRYDFPPKWNVVGPSEVRQFDIVYGPYSARYGGNSMGGVVSVTTLDPKESSAYGTVQSLAMPFREYGLNQTFKGYSGEAGFTWKQTDGPWTIRAGYRHFENVGQSMTYTLLTPTTGTAAEVTGASVDPRLATPVFGAASPVEVTQDQYRLRAGFEFANGWKADALFLTWLTQQNLTDTRSFLSTLATGAPVLQGKVKFNGVVYNATGLTQSLTDRREYLAGVKLGGLMGDWEANFNFSHYWIAAQDTRTSKDLITGLANTTGTQALADNPGWWTFDSSMVRKTDGHALAMGFNANRYETRTDTFNTTNWRTAATPVFSSATYGKTSLLGAFVEDEARLSARTSLTTGIRLEQWSAFGGGIGKLYGTSPVFDAYATRTETSVSPKLSVQSTLSEVLSVQLSLGIATRYPTVGELFQGRLDDITRQIDPTSFDPNLKPERSRDANFMVRRSFEKVRLTGSVFAQNIQDAVFSFSGLNQFGTVISSYKNIDKVNQYGAEVIFEAQDLLLRGLDLDASVAYLDARTVRNVAAPAAEGVQFPRIPNWRSNGNLRYRLSPVVKASVGWRYATRPNSDLFGLQRGTAYGFQSEYCFVDTRLSWDISVHSQLSLGIDNIGNTQSYVAHPLPQRSAMAEFRFRL